MNKNVRLVDRAISAYVYPLLIKHLLHTPIVYAPNQEIVYRDQLRFTYRDFYKRVSRLANLLTSISVGPGDTVAVMDWDSHRYLECFFAVPMIGAILHTVNVRFSPEQILKTVNHAEGIVLLTHQDFLPIIEQIKNQFNTVKKIILLKDMDSKVEVKISLVGEYEEMLSNVSDQFDFPDFDENAKATIFYTTGTTGEPKGVFFSHRQLVLHTLATLTACASFISPCCFRSNDVYMPLTPMFHVHAWGIPYVATVLGVKQVYPGRYESSMLLKLLINENVTFSHCVTTILHMLLSSKVSNDIDLSKWKVAIGGSALPKGLARMAMERGIDVFSGYGMSETGPILALAMLKPDKIDADLEYQLDIRTKTGLPIPLVDLRVVDSQMRDVPYNSTGEIVVRAPWLTQSYFKDSKKGNALWRGGYLHTGDIAKVDKHGYVKITDRLKDIIKTGGEWISSLELENLISQHQAISEVVVVGVSDKKWGERPVAVIVVKSEFDGKFIDQDLKNYLSNFVKNGAISKWAVPERIIVVKSIPKTSVGKNDKKVIKVNIKDNLI